MNIAIAVAVLVLVAANAAATIFVASADCYTRKQKLAQSCVVWFIPFLGAVVVATFLRAHRERIEHLSQHVPESNEIGQYAAASHSASHDP